jgi:hypothetical protein
MALKELRVWEATCDWCKLKETGDLTQNGPCPPRGWIRIEWRHAKGDTLVYHDFHSVGCLGEWAIHWPGTSSQRDIYGADAGSSLAT